MTNNLKAERTLTAERLEDIKNQLGDDTFAGITRTAELKVPELRSIIEELQHLRLQSLSTQQPMGEVTEAMVSRALSGLWRGQGLGWNQHQCMRSALSEALHPNQESGE